MSSHADRDSLQSLGTTGYGYGNSTDFALYYGTVARTEFDFTLALVWTKGRRLVLRLGIRKIRRFKKRPPA